MGHRRHYYVSGKTGISKWDGDRQIICGSYSILGIRLADEAIVFAGHNFPLQLIPIVLFWKSCVILEFAVLPQAFFEVFIPKNFERTAADRRKIANSLY